MNDTTTISLNEIYQRRLNEEYQTDLQNGFNGSFDDWNHLRNEKYIKQENEKKQKQQEEQRIYNLPKNKILRSHQVYNKLLPINWDSKTFENMTIETGSKLEKIVKVLKTQTLEDCGIWLSGGVGCGKTHLMLSLFNHISELFINEYDAIGEYVKYYNYSDLCSILRDDPNNFEKFQKIRSPYFLFIDDLGVSKSSDFIQEKIYSLFNYRVEQNLITFVTTNLSLKEVQEEFNDRMVSRIKESSAWIDMTGVKDYRSSFIKNNMKRFKEVIE